MGLVRCEECGHRVSDQARTCPGCGCPFVPPRREPTPKHYKAMQALGVVMMLLATVVIVGACQQRHAAHFYEGALVWLCGLGLWASVRVIAWWHSG